MKECRIPDVSGFGILYAQVWCMCLPTIRTFSSYSTFRRLKVFRIQQLSCTVQVELGTAISVKEGTGGIKRDVTKLDYFASVRSNLSSNNVFKIEVRERRVVGAFQTQ